MNILKTYLFSKNFWMQMSKSCSINVANLCAMNFLKKTIMFLNRMMLGLNSM